MQVQYSASYQHVNAVKNKKYITKFLTVEVTKINDEFCKSAGVIFQIA